MNHQGKVNIFVIFLPCDLRALPMRQVSEFVIAAWSFPIQYAADAKIAADIDHRAEAVEEPVDRNQQQTVFERKTDSGKYESHRNKAC